MAHHAQEKGAHNGALADHVGPFSAILALGGFIGAVVLVIKHPIVGLKCVFMAFVFTTISPDPMQHPLLGIIALMVGASMAPTKG